MLQLRPFGPSNIYCLRKDFDFENPGNGPIDAVWKLHPSSLASLWRKKKEHFVVKHVSKLALARGERLKETVQRR